MKNGICALLLILCIYGNAQSALDSAGVVKRSCIFKTYPAYVNSWGRPVLRNQHASFGRKFLRATGFVLASEAGEMTVLFLSPYGISKWVRTQFPYVGNHYREAFTRPPTLDKDDALTDFFEHPYQGAFDYNCMRSQGATILQSSLFVMLHSTLWEYAIESSEERPSIQDLIVTPLAGSVLGELVHLATMQMIRNGLTWYEKVFVCLLNPAFLLNNGLNFVKPLNTTRHFYP